MEPKIVLFSIAAMLGVAMAAPVHTIARLPRTEAPSQNLADILPSGVTDFVSEVLDKVPVDVSVDAPVLPEKRDPAVTVDLGGAGLSLKQREADPAIAVDLGGAGVSLKQREADPVVTVDLGGAGLSLR